MLFATLAMLIIDSDPKFIIDVVLKFDSTGKFESFAAVVVECFFLCFTLGLAEIFSNIK